MTDTLLRVEQLKTVFQGAATTVRAVDGISFSIARGETLALLGESGCGKSISALSLLQLVPQPAGRIVGGQVWLDDTDILQLPERDMRNVRGKRIAMIFQEPQSSLNPVLTIGAQIREALVLHDDKEETRLHERVLELLRKVGIADPERRYSEYPHQLSGGMKQRIMIAMALASEPDLLIADEPTTALDVTIQAQILGLLDEIKQKTGMAILLITHNLGVVAQLADRVAVMYAGEIVELAPARDFFAQPRHPYTRLLFQSLPGRHKRDTHLQTIPGSVPSLANEFSGCRFVERCDRALQACRDQIPQWLGDATGGVRCHLYDDSVAQAPLVQSKDTTAMAADTPASSAQDQSLLQVQDLKMHFPIHKGVLQRVVGHVKAVDGVSFELSKGRTLALVGESGCGKTTVGKGILQLVRPTHGSVCYDGNELTALSVRELRPLRSHIQIIFQDPFASLNPRMQISSILQEGMLAQGIFKSAAERNARVQQLLEQVGLPANAAQRYPHEFSGGQRQRISIARALAVNPDMIVCDEPTSALDVSVQAQILNLLQQLQRELGLSYLFITHDLSVVEYLAHDVAVMYLGRIVEQGSLQEIADTPKHPYTQALLAAVPLIEKGVEAAAGARPLLRLEGDLPSPSKPPQGCHFHPRCPQAMPECRQDYPARTTLSASHVVHCHLYGEGDR